MAADESLTLGERTLADIKAALERLMEQHRRRRRRYRVNQRPRTAARIEKHLEVAEMVLLWEAVLAIVFPDLKLPPKRLVDWVGRQHGLGRTQVYAALDGLDHWQRKQLRALAEAFAQEWADARS
jgi:hypothetical protein